MGGEYGDTLKIETAPGARGTAQTIEAMRALVDDAVENSAALHSIAAAIVADAQRGDVRDQLQRLWNVLRERIHFKHDTVGREHLRHPDQLLLEIARNGRTACDCDDVSTLGAALLKAMGIRAAFILASRRPDRRAEHVFFGAIVGDRVIPLDPQENVPLGVWPAHLTRRDVHEV